MRICTIFLSFAGWALGSAAQADNIDLKLYSETAKIIEQLQKNGFKSVGVLHFRCQKGVGKESFTLGPICSSMATRLERALVLHDPVDKPILIAKDVTGAALARKIGGWQKNPAERAKLFGIPYAPMWGTAPVKPDALISGVVRVSKDLAITTVIVEAFSAKSPEKTIKLHEFSVGTDRGILHEIGQSYEISASTLAGKRSADRDRLAVQSAFKRDTEAPAEAGTGAAGVTLEILYDGQPQEIKGDPNSSGERRVDPPQPGVKIAFRVRNDGSRAPVMGAALSVNGRSFWRQETGDISHGQIWIFESTKGPTEFKGFYMDEAGQNLIPFKVLTAQESETRAAEFGDKVGLIQMDVFEPRAMEAEEDMKISLARSLTRSGKSAKIESLEDAKRAVLTSDRKLFRTARNSPSQRNLIVGEDENLVPGGDIAIQSMPNPVRVGGITIRYYDAKKGGDAMQISN